MFLSRNKKNNEYPCKPQFYYIKVGFEGVKIIWACFRDEHTLPCVVVAWTETTVDVLAADVPTVVEEPAKM